MDHTNVGKARFALTALGCAAALLFAVGGVEGEVTSSAAHGFTTKSTAEIAAPPADVFKALVGEVGRWWDSAHTFSGDAGNLFIDPRPGRCFCEQLPDGGGVLHMTVVYAEPGKTLRLAGALGPLQSLGVTGSLTFSLAAAEAGGTEMTVSYTVGGYTADGLESWAAPVDSVLGQQLERLKRFVETGSPEPAPAPQP